MNLTRERKKNQRDEEPLGRETLALRKTACPEQDHSTWSHDLKVYEQFWQMRSDENTALSADLQDYRVSQPTWDHAWEFL